jgi:2-keto-myo-inositol isomerase
LSLAPHFGLNHVAVPRLDLPAFFGLAGSLGITQVEIRNDLPGTAIMNGASPASVRDAAARAGVTIVAINALQRFDEWGAARASEATALAEYAAEAGARGLVLVPVNDGSRAAGEGRHAELSRSLEALGRILGDRGVVGLVEPLGFLTSSLRSKQVAATAIANVGGPESLRLVHDTFHHALADESAIYPALTGLVHLSGVNDRGVAPTDLQDRHRGLVSAQDRLGSIGQARMLLAQGYAGPLSFEPFAPEVQGLEHPAPSIRESMEFIRKRLLEEAA